MNLEHLEIAERWAARWLNEVERLDDGSSLSAARLQAAQSRHARIEAELGEAILAESVAVMAR